MTKEITKAFILQEIEDKFKLRELVPDRFRFSEEVVPVYNVEPHLTKPEVQHTTTSVTSGPTAYWFFTVPQTEKWVLHRYNIIFKTGVYTVAGLMIYRPDVAKYMYVDLAAGQSVSYTHDFVKDVVLDARDSIYLYVDGYTSTGDLELRIDVTVEEIR